MSSSDGSAALSSGLSSGLSSTPFPARRPRPPGRCRQALRRAACLAASLVLAAQLGGCGFTLRGVQHLPFDTIVLNVPPNSPLGIELSRNIRTGTSTKVITKANEAAAVFELLSQLQDRTTLTIDAQGRAIEYTLHYRVRFRLLDGKGREMIEPTLLQVQRDIAFNDSQRLSKESEEVLLYRDMQTDLVQQLLRRLAAAKPYAAAD